MVKSDKPRLYQFWGWNTQGDFGPYTFYTSKRKGLVFFPRAPPKEPASPWQTHQRKIWTAIADMWTNTTQANRDAWEAASKKLRLSITGYNLWMWYHCHGDRPTIATIERQSGITLLP